MHNDFKMNEREILSSIKEALNYLSKEKAKDFYYGISSYADDYDKNSIRSLINNWEELKGGKFFEVFPITWGLVLSLRAIWDSQERETALYEDIISYSELAIKEIADYLEKAE